MCDCCLCMETFQIFMLDWFEKRLLSGLLMAHYFDLRILPIAFSFFVAFLLSHTYTWSYPQCNVFFRSTSFPAHFDWIQLSISCVIYSNTRHLSRLFQFSNKRKQNATCTPEKQLTTAPSFVFSLFIQSLKNPQCLSITSLSHWTYKTESTRRVLMIWFDSEHMKNVRQIDARHDSFSGNVLKPKRQNCLLIWMLIFRL